jgi:hypothetical protein
MMNGGRIVTSLTIRRVSKPVAVGVGLFGAVAALGACPSSLDDSCFENACVRADAGGDVKVHADAEMPAVVVPADCDEAADVIAPEAKGCVVEAFAVFVDADGGSDDNEGTKAKPLRTMGAAVAKVATTGKRRIYICGSATYAEHVKLTTAVSLHGGFACGTWEPDSGSKPKVAPADKGYALHIDNVSKPVKLSDLELRAADVSSLKDGTSSIAVFANKANLTLLRVTVHASNGADGSPGQSGDPGAITRVSSGTLDANGNAASGATGGARKECTCSTSTTVTVGGVGGANASGGGQGTPDYGAASPNNGAGGIGGRGECTGDGTGRNGADAPPAANAPPPATRGTLDADGWKPAKGVDATENGKPGQGGGGCGGCGGFAGKGGGGGGASIAHWRTRASSASPRLHSRLGRPERVVVAVPEVEARRGSSRKRSLPRRKGRQRRRRRRRLRRSRRRLDRRPLRR